jgi:hypothetical protein
MSTSAKILSIYWDCVLDSLEEVICKEKCVCCRALSYNDILLDLEYYDQTDGDTTFQRVQQVRLDMLIVVSQLFPNATVFGAMDVECPTACHHQNHGLGKPQIRKLKDAEQQLIGALHFHPLIREHHVCFLCFAAASEYKVELAMCDTDLAMKEAMGYASILEGVRDLYV